VKDFEAIVAAINGMLAIFRPPMTDEESQRRHEELMRELRNLARGES
jgi:hypothetical protein